MIRVIGNTIEFNRVPVATIREGIGATERASFIETIEGAENVEDLREELEELKEFYKDSY